MSLVQRCQRWATGAAVAVSAQRVRVEESLECCCHGVGLFHHQEVGGSGRVYRSAWGNQDCTSSAP